MTITMSNDNGSVGINRYIVGCKFVYPYSLVSNFMRINRYIVGCKYKKDRQEINLACELIDT